MNAEGVYRMHGTPDSQMISAHILENLAAINDTRVPLEFILKLNDITRRPDVEINEVAKLIEREPNMCAQFMRLSNTAYFSRGQRIGSVNQAIVRLGLDTVNRIIVSFGIFDIASDTLKYPFFNEADFLKSSIAGAMISEEVARICGVPDTDEIYICTLLRNFGVFILKQYFPDLFETVFSIVHEKKWPFSFTCLMACGIDHHQISSRIFSQWKLPILIADPPAPDDARNKKLVLVKRIFGHVDYLLKKNDYGQWDPYSIPSERSVNLFSKNEDFDISVKRILAEADEFTTQLIQSFNESPRFR
jgi:HD-like signal output (HDOD) protein